MAAAPDLTACQAYLAGVGGSWADADVTDALAAELEAQKGRCRIPQVLSDPNDPDSDLIDDYLSDLAEALKRRVAVNLVNRPIPLGVQMAATEFGVAGVRVGGLDREVRKFEARYRKRLVG